MPFDFSELQQNPLRMYGGRNGNKICVFYNGCPYMIKFPPKPTLNPEMSYTNSCISEYVACHIFSELGFETQETLLGTYGEKVVVACKDFAVGGFQLKEFAMLKNTFIESSQSGYGTDLGDVLQTIREQTLLPSYELESFFWRMFVADALLGNFDRHNGNWGFLTNEQTGEVRIAPIFDCGSCLYPQLTEAGMEHVIESDEEIQKRLYQFPASALKQNDVKINYATFLITNTEPLCLQALCNVGRKIDLRKINHIIENTPYISGVHKSFLKTMLAARYKGILEPAIDRANVLDSVISRISFQQKSLEEEPEL